MDDRGFWNDADFVVTVDLFGSAPHCGKIAACAEEYLTRIIEDAAQAFGAEYDGKVAGNLGSFAGCFSFHPSKPLGAIGDAGMVVTDDEDAANLMRTRRNHGQGAKYEYIEAGLNSRMDEIQAAAILDKLDGYAVELYRRRGLARFYRRHIDGVRHPIKSCGVISPSFSIYPVLFKSQEQRDKAKAALSEAGIWCRVYYPTPLHLQPAFSFLGYKRGSFPRAERAAETILALPMDEKACEVDEIERLVKIIGGVVGK